MMLPFSVPEEFYFVLVWFVIGVGAITALVEYQPPAEKREWEQNLTRIWWPYRILMFTLIYGLWPLMVLGQLWDNWMKKKKGNG